MTEQTEQTPTRNYTGPIIFTWAVVLIPLGYGIYNAVKAAAQLFTG